MGAKVGITFDLVVETAEVIADRDGFGSLTLAAVASELGIKSPSLYAHVDGLPGLKRALMLRAASELAARFDRAVSGITGPDAVRSLATAYRQFSLEHSGLYQALLEPAPRQGEDDEVFVALGAPVAVVAGVLDGMGVAADRMVHLIRGLRAMLHGFVDIESKRGFGMPIDVDESFDTAVEMVVTAIRVEAGIA